jgi:hypothetical protein
MAPPLPLPHPGEGDITDKKRDAVITEQIIAIILINNIKNNDQVQLTP